MSSRLAACVLVLGVALAPVQTLAQQTVIVIPPPPGLPSILPQTQAFTSCVLNCDTTVGLCQGACSVNNSPVALATPVGGPRPDPNALAQCFISCTSQQLNCKQACTPPH